MLRLIYPPVLLASGVSMGILLTLGLQWGVQQWGG